MAPSPFFRTETPQGDRLDHGMTPGVGHAFDTGSVVVPSGAYPFGPPAFATPGSRLVARWNELVARIPRAWLGMSGYVATGVALGLVLILLVSFLGGDAHDKPHAPTVTVEVVHLHAKDIGSTCWRGATNTTVAKLTVSLEIGLDGKVRSALATGGPPVMNGCVESHVKAWSFLPQAQSSQMVLPFEVDAR